MIQHGRLGINAPTKVKTYGSISQLGRVRCLNGPCCKFKHREFHAFPSRLIRPVKPPTSRHSNQQRAHQQNNQRLEPDVGRQIDRFSHPITHQPDTGDRQDCALPPFTFLLRPITDSSKSEKGRDEYITIRLSPRIEHGQDQRSCNP